MVFRLTMLNRMRNESSSEPPSLNVLTDVESTRLQQILMWNVWNEDVKKDVGKIWSVWWEEMKQRNQMMALNQLIGQVQVEGNL